MQLLQPLRQKTVALLWSGLATSAAGDQLGNVALSWIAVDAMGTAAGYLGALQACVTVVAALFIGRWTDAYNERWVMMVADVSRALVLAASVAFWMLHGHVTTWLLISVISILAVGQAAFRPAVQAIMPNLASISLLPATNALLDATDRLARIVGPALIAAMAVILPVRHFLTLDALSFMVSAGAVLLIGQQPTRFHRGSTSSKEMLLRGFKALWAHPLLGYLLATSGINNGAWYAAMFLGIPLLLSGTAQAATTELRAFGTVLACYGVTNLIGNLVVGSRPSPASPAGLILSGVILNGTGILLIGTSNLLPGFRAFCIYVGAALAGFGGPMNDIPRTTLMQTQVPRPDVAAAFRSWMVAANLGILVAMVGAPTLFRAVGPTNGISLCGIAIVLVGISGLRWIKRDVTD